jgi:oxalate decarboxylase/phosphoglucose isomerase-like protein (cupin superfamily)
MENLFHFESSEPRKFRGGTLHRASARDFPVLEDLAIQGLHLKAGAVREPHIHPNAHQLDYCVSGSARVGIVGPEGQRQLLELRAGDISFVPQGHLHWIESTGPDDLHFLVMLSDREPQTIELSEMLAGVPNDTLARALGIPGELLERMPTKAVTISPVPVM